MGLVLIILMGIWSVIGVEFFSEIAEKEFGTFSWAMFTMAKAMLGEFIATTNKLVYEKDQPLAAIFFFSFIFIVGIVMMNVVVAILLENYLDYKEDDETLPTPSNSSRGVRNLPKTPPQNDVSPDKMYPVLYVKRGNIMYALRTVNEEQLEETQEFLKKFSPPDGEDREEDKFSDELVEDWSIQNVKEW